MIVQILVAYLIALVACADTNSSLAYRRLLPCIQNNILMTRKADTISIPDDLSFHFEQVLNKTSIYRGLPYHGDTGRWIENHFIDHFMNFSIDYYQGMIPLFVQWTDIHVHAISADRDPSLNVKCKSLHENMLHELNQVLRPNVLYFTVVQDDQGLPAHVAKAFPNILVLSAGGYGHIPLPLIKGELDYVPPPSKFNTLVGFYGTVQRNPRNFMLAEVATQCKNMQIRVDMAKYNNWKEKMANTKFNLAPRGFGRNSFRVAEIVQMGRFPVLLYNDVAWYPYSGSPAGLDQFGLIGKYRALGDLVSTMKQMSDEEYQKRLNWVKENRIWYTYAGAIKQIELFLSDPLGPGGGFLKCVPVPNSVLGHI